MRAHAHTRVILAGVKNDAVGAKVEVIGATGVEKCAKLDIVARQGRQEE